MPTVQQIEAKLFEFAPPDLKMDWDNVGLLVGEPDRLVEKVLVALDITWEVAEEASRIGAQLIVAHHPLINCKWLPVQTVRSDTPQGALLIALLKGDISAICMHTNLDAASGGVNDALAAALRVNDPGPLTREGIGRVGTLSEPVPLRRFVAEVSRCLHCNGLRYADGGRSVHRVAVGGGACGDFVDQAVAAGCDTFVTSDLSYHDFLDARPKGINLIDAGHFPTEQVVCPVIIDTLKQAFPELEIVLSASHGEVIQYYV
ncbi:Nif3-like dinuclear metal center hexameric protein [Oscillibacter sp. MSJ-2]|uniref:Nif3-like dinuclear metal center hexameric protein n=1 Tax=Dysosmobacter acutus TaxID=2841504 RepID=A0ABS6FAM2_9FIRM|nr:Nif3-like dinuclear metal center hexameric protein [Dysosmobacter acutus]MBU5627222.1 Nif3-like dinuclear metal center hexameric protein [Dysosmobacter acutus]